MPSRRAFTIQACRGAERAQLAPIILDLASKGDEVSLAIVAEGVDALSSCVFITSRQLGIKSPTVLLAGGLLQHTYFSNSLEAALNARIPNAIITQPILSPTAGAVLMALKAANCEISEASIEKLKEDLIFLKLKLYMRCLARHT